MKKEARLLFVDNDQSISKFIREYLELRGFSVCLKHNAESGMAVFKKEKFDLCLFNVEMPFQNGFSLGAAIREVDAEIPIVFLTKKENDAERITALKFGAEDYIVKTFGMEALYLRIKIILKRVNRQEPETGYKIGNFDFDPVFRELNSTGNAVRLSAIEAKLLQLFCNYKNKLLTRDLALSRIWKDEDYLRARSLNVYVSKLRKYLAQDSNIEILNVHGEGYRMVVKNEVEVVL